MPETVDGVTAIRQIVDASIRNFANGLSTRHIREANNPDGVINSKRNNVFMRELGDEFIFYSAFVRSFDSSFGKTLENMGNNIAQLHFRTEDSIESFILPAQETKIQELINSYSTDAENRISPEIEHYNSFTCIVPRNIESFKRIHKTDHLFCDIDDNGNETYYVIELKAGGDLDVKKAPTEKKELLNEYFMVKNKYPNASVSLYFATAYNKFGEGNEWKQHIVRDCFADEELLIGKDYWNFICKDNNGFNIVIDQYRHSVSHIQRALTDIKNAYCL